MGVSNEKRCKTKYQEICKKMAIQNSTTTRDMFIESPKLWEDYHKARDHSFKGYDKQEEIPVNKIIAHLETKKKHKLTVLDLGCGRNIIQEKFVGSKITIRGYDYICCNGYLVADISNLPEEDESIDIVVFSQSLMGSNWKEYLREAYRVLRYNGEVIISESIERLDIIQETVKELGYRIMDNDYTKSETEQSRWFYIHAIKQ